ncbi:cytochrome c oxidase subunit 8A, mitochondrial [Numida meleagris]|uniref:cytochrome c oxidase subunit 8A, mitochondrial n=1 Tax=Numida meleagris TaxID=8996 RepID=UPI000B3DFF3E|nr:cytochrome c oxidase subunit 8A, mitochondrial [Numida meleagris]
MSALGKPYLSTNSSAKWFPAPASFLPPEVRLHFRLSQVVAAMPLFGRFASSLLRPAVRPASAPRGFVSGPPQHHVGTAETVVGLLAMFVTCLGPAAWVLAHLEDYKKRE